MNNKITIKDLLTMTSGFQWDESDLDKMIVQFQNTDDLLKSVIPFTVAISGKWQKLTMGSMFGLFPEMVVR